MVVVCDIYGEWYYQLSVAMFWIKIAITINQILVIGLPNLPKLIRYISVL